MAYKRSTRYGMKPPPGGNAGAGVRNAAVTVAAPNRSVKIVTAPCRTEHKGGNPPRNLNPWK